jgi:diguanylate cyclase (GGDEF)-like protein
VSLIADGLAAWDNVRAIWVTWWLGDAAGALLVAPLVLAWYGNPRLRWNWRQLPERVLFYVTVVFFGLEVFGSSSYHHVLPLDSYLLAFMAVPILLWAPFRLGFRAAMSGTVILGVVALWGTFQGAGPFAYKDLNEALLLVQSFMAIIAVTILIVSAAQQQLEQTRRRLEQANTELTEASVTDALTGARNRRGFDQRLAEELERSARFQQPLSLLLMDVDLFKQHNDLFGHLAGDEVLKTIVRLLQEHSRATDTVARQGGDEFAVLLPNTESDGAVMMAERFRSAIENAPWQANAVTVTVGVATLSSDASHGAKLLGLADQALYEAKEAGRNRIAQAKVAPA